MALETTDTEAGYTLIESLVAMAIFLTVLIPVASSVGNVLIISDTSAEHKALYLAQSEIAVSLTGQMTGLTEKALDGYRLQTEVRKEERITTVTVRVFWEGRTIVVLHKSMLTQ